MSNFINNPSTIEDLKHNVYFQLDNLIGWLSMDDYESALIKAKCLVDALSAVVTAQESEQIAL